MDKTIIVIPARLESTRFPRKLLEMAGEKTVLEHTYEAAVLSGVAASVFVATDSNEINEFCIDHGMYVVMTGKHRNGTQRVAVAVQLLEGLDKHNGGKGLPFEYVINWQADEPMVKPEDVKGLLATLKRGVNSIATLVAPCGSEDWTDRNAVKVAVSEYRVCLYFTRATIANPELHIGVYAFERAALFHAAIFKESPLGKAERLEQLDWLNAGIQIKACEINNTPISINTPEDLEKFKETLE